MLDEGQRNDWFASNLIVVSAVIAVVGLVGAVVWELRQKDPVVDLRLLKERNFPISTVTMFMLGFVLYGSTMLLPLFLQTLLGYTAMLSGLVLSPGGLRHRVDADRGIPALARGGALAGRRRALGFGAGLFHMAGFNLEVDYRTAILARMVQSLGLAFLFVPINTMAFAFVPKEKTNYATGLINLARNIGGSTGIAMVTTLLARRTQFHQHALVSNLTPLDPRYRETLSGIAAHLVAKGQSPPDATHQAEALIYGMVQRHAAMQAFLDAFWVMGIIFLAMVPLMFVMKKTAPHKAPARLEQ